MVNEKSSFETKISTFTCHVSFNICVKLTKRSKFLYLKTSVCQTFNSLTVAKKLPLEGRIYRQNLYTKTLEASTLKDSTFEGVEDQGPRNRGGRGVRTPTGFEKLKSKYAIKTANFRFLWVNCRIWAPTNVYCLRGPC